MLIRVLIQDRKDCLSPGMEQSYVFVTKEKKKMQFMLNLNPKPIEKHWTLSLFSKVAWDKEIACPSNDENPMICPCTSISSDGEAFRPVLTGKDV